jgi:hypothetical protein
MSSRKERDRAYYPRGTVTTLDTPPFVWSDWRFKLLWRNWENSLRRHIADKTALNLATQGPKQGFPKPCSEGIRQYPRFRGRSLPRFCKVRGVTLVPYDAVAAFIRNQGRAAA